MLVVNFGNCFDEMEKINKSFSNVKTCNCDVYGESSILNPNLLLRYDSVLTSCNYAYIGEWNRYYWILNQRVINGGRMVISCQVDPLNSCANAILNLDVNVIRNEFERNKLIYDSQYPEEILSTVSVLKFNASPFGVNGGYNTILTVIGGNKHGV